MGKAQNTAAVSRRTFLTASLAGGAAAAAGHAALSAVASESNGTHETSVPAWLGEEPEIADVIATKECDILIIGAGNGGMAAAATASDLGADFLVAEAYDTVQDTRHWIGAVNTTYTEAANVKVDVARLRYELARYASFKCNQRLHNMWIDESAEMVEWIGRIEEEEGLIGYVDTELGQEIDPANPTGSYIPPQQHLFVDPTTMNPMQTELPARNASLLARIERAGNANRMLWGHTLVRLVHNNGPITGAIFATDDGNVQINAAKGVILATGGYPANTDMVEALAPVIPACCTTMSCSPKDRGDGIRAGIWAGGVKDVECAPMIFDRGPVAPGVGCGYDDNHGLPASTTDPLNFLGSQPFMKVSRSGKRFCNESCPYDYTCFAAQQHEGGVWASIMDANAAQDMARFATDGCSKVLPQILASGVPFDELYADLISAGLMIKADTIDELADKMGFAGESKEAFLVEVERYNGFFDNQNDDDFSKPAYRLSEIRTAPFYGQWYGGTILTTCDGLAIDEECRVLNAARKPLGGLYAIGDCSGSFFANNYPEYLVGVACGRTLTQGRHVVRKITGDLA